MESIQEVRMLWGKLAEKGRDVGAEVAEVATSEVAEEGFKLQAGLV